MAVGGHKLVFSRVTVSEAWFLMPYANHEHSDAVDQPRRNAYRTMSRSRWR